MPDDPASTPTASEVLVRAGRILPEVGRVILAQIVRAEGSTPGKVGWKLVVTPDGAAFGNLGGGSFEAMVRVDATAKLESRRGNAAAESEVKRYYFTEKAVRGEPTGMVCGGLAEVFLEVLTAPPVLVICGGGPVGQAVARAGALAGFEPLVVEDRAAFREPAAFPAGTLFCDAGRDFREQPFLRRAEDRDLAGRDLYVAVVSRCWQTDTAALAAVFEQLATAAGETGVVHRPRLAYLGLLGSRRKVARVRAELSARGYGAGEPGEVGDAGVRAGVPLRAPIGLPLGGDSPGEIAISILAEILQVRHRTGDAAVADVDSDPATTGTASTTRSTPVDTATDSDVNSDPHSDRHSEVLAP